MPAWHTANQGADRYSADVKMLRGWGGMEEAPRDTRIGARIRTACLPCIAPALRCGSAMSKSAGRVIGRRTFKAIFLQRNRDYDVLGTQLHKRNQGTRRTDGPEYCVDWRKACRSQEAGETWRLGRVVAGKFRVEQTDSRSHDASGAAVQISHNERFAD